MRKGKNINFKRLYILKVLAILLILLLYIFTFMKHYCDFLVIGSGIAGLSYALKVAPYGKVIVITKSSIDETSTHYAQGGIAAVMAQSRHIRKTYQRHHYCWSRTKQRKIVRITIEESTESIKELINLGANFDKNTDGEYDLAKEGGHSEKEFSSQRYNWSRNSKSFIGANKITPKHYRS